MATSVINITINCGGYCDKVLRLFHECQSVICTPSSCKASFRPKYFAIVDYMEPPPPPPPSRNNFALRDEIYLLYTECQSSFIPVSYWLRTNHMIVEKFYCLPGNVAKRWTLLLFTGK